MLGHNYFGGAPRNKEKFVCDSDPQKNPPTNQSINQDIRK